MQILKQSTASQSIVIGPFVDSTDGVTAETGLTIANTDIRLSKNGANIVGKNSGGGTHDEIGYYTITLDATDTNTVGTLQLMCNMTGALPVYHEFQIVEENVYDKIFGASADLGTDIDAILTDTGTTLDAAIATIDSNVDAILVDTGTTLDAAIATIDSNVDAILVDTSTTLDTKLNDIQGATFNTSTDSLEAIRNRGDSAWTGSPTTSDSGTAQAGAAGSITLQSGASATDDTYNGQVVYISSGTGAGQSRAIEDYTGSSKVATVISNWATAPDNTSVYEIYPDDITEITSAPTASQIADAVWDENTAGHTTSGTFGEQVKNDIDAILVDTGTTLDGKIDTIDTNVDAILVDSNELQGDWTNGGRLDLIIDQILADTADMQPKLGTPVADIASDIASIQTDTNDIQTRLPAALNNGAIPADIQRINDINIVGNGSGTPFNV